MNNLVEEERNRLLRRADWRFLLANPWPEKSICFSAGFLSQAVKSVSSISIPENESAPGECDLAVATNPNTITLQKAWKALQPGGSFYSEWFSPLAGGPLGIRERLRASGFTNIKCYWSWPIPAYSQALFWLPLDAPQIIRFHLSYKQHSPNLLARIRRSVLLFFWMISRGTGLLAPICVTAQKPDSMAKNVLTTKSDKGLFTSWEEEKSVSIPDPLDTLMWTGGKRSINKVILYRFAHGEETPHHIVKFPRTPETVPAIIHEANVLQALRANKTEAASRAPAVLFYRCFNNQVALGETPVLGQPMYTVLSQKNALGLAMKVTEWLASMATGDQLFPRKIWWERLVEPALHDFEQAFRPVLAGSELPECRSILNRLGDLPKVFEHRDCSPWNLLITRTGELAVLDWESAEPEGLPFLDLTYFLTYLVFFLDGAMKNGSTIQSYRRASDASSLTGRLRNTCQQHYIQMTGLDPAILHPLRLLTWLIHSRSEVRHLSEDAGSFPHPSALRSSLFYNLILEELALAQFPLQGII